MIPLDVNLEHELEEPVIVGERLYQRPVGVINLTIKAYDRESDQTATYTAVTTNLELTLLPAEPDDRERGIRLNDAANGNRWAAFTDDELLDIASGVRGNPELVDQANAELEARTALRSKPA